MVSGLASVTWAGWTAGSSLFSSGPGRPVYAAGWPPPSSHSLRQSKSRRNTETHTGLHDILFLLSLLPQPPSSLPHFYMYPLSFPLPFLLSFSLLSLASSLLKTWTNLILQVFLLSLDLSCVLNGFYNHTTILEIGQRERERQREANREAERYKNRQRLTSLRLAKSL